MKRKIEEKLKDWKQKSNGKTALTGTSYLTWSQWFIAQIQPPHLTCINPNEGLSDAYRDLFYDGGIPEPHFLERLAPNHVSAAGGRREDLVAEMKKYPFMVIVGEKEETDNAVSVRAHGQVDMGAMALEAFAQMINDKVKEEQSIR